MTDTSDWSVLVPIQILEGETVPDALVELLSPLPVTILGYHVVPEQTPPGQARLQFEDRAEAKLDDVAETFGERGVNAATRLVFTHEKEQTIDRVAAETGATAMLASNPTGDVERLLVPLGGAVDVERVGRFLAALLDGRDIGVTLYHAAPSENAVEDGERLLVAATETMVASGVPASSIDRDVDVSERPVEAIARAATDHDAAVMGESAPSLGSLLFGDASERIADRSVGPVLVVRKAQPGTERNAADTDGEGEDAA